MALKALALVVFAGAGAAALLLDRNTAEANALTIAVLPLANLSAIDSQEYFVDGMTESLIASLAKLSGLDVISRTSIMRCKGMVKPLSVSGRVVRGDAPRAMPVRGDARKYTEYD